MTFVSRESQCFPRRSRYDLLYRKTKQAKANFEKRAEKPATTSGHLQLHAVITCSSSQHFAGNSKLFPVLRHSFRNVARSWHLARNCLIVRCHVTMN